MPKTDAESFCPTCGQRVRSGLDAEALLRILTTGTPHREVYHGRDGGWFVTYGGGETTPEAVNYLYSRGLIRSVYSDPAAEAFHVGKTLDVAATQDARKKQGKSAPLIYLDKERRER